MSGSRSRSLAGLIALCISVQAAGAQEPAPLPLQPVAPDTIARDTVPADTVIDTPAPPVFRVCAGGDITLGTNLDTTWQKLGARRLRASYGMSDSPHALVAPLKPIFADAHLVLLNVETAIGEGPARTKCGPRSKNCYAFRGPPESAYALRSLGDSAAVVVGNVANNHARDAGPEGYVSTMRHLRSAGILVTGHDTLATPVQLADSTTVGVIGFYTGDILADARNLGAVRRHVARAVEQFGTVIVTAHIGAEGIGAQRTRDSTEWFLESRIDRGNPVAFARAAFDAGATLVIGHGPHVLRAAEWYDDDRLAIYSLGNLLTYGPFSNVEPINRGAVACADIAGRRVLGADIRPTVQRAPGVVAYDHTRRALMLIDSLSLLDFPTNGARVDPWGELRRVRVTIVDTAETTSAPLRKH
ncbi:MAG TPA: CapA family protein [Gemmatimonadaceae bacterium]|nr:CapA family protein [Gemmatimonadaceae bacterium]